MAHKSENKTMIERFDEKFIPVTETGCWLWTASCNERGYGLFFTGRNLRKGKIEFAHRVSYELYKGYCPSPEDSVCHSCDNPYCVNPDHLFIGTHKDNMRDMANKGRVVNGKARLKEEDVLAILNYPHNTKTTAKHFGIDKGYCSRLRNFLVKKWAYLKYQNC